MLYRTGAVEKLVGYTNVDWAGNVGDRRSTSEFAFSLESVTITWSSNKQPTIALSAEYRGAVVATSEAIWLTRLLKDLRVEVFDPTTIYCNNLSNIQLVKNPYSMLGPSTFRCTTILSTSESFPVKSNFNMFDGSADCRYLHQTPGRKLRRFSSALGLQHLDMPNLRGRNIERSGRDRKRPKMDTGGATKGTSPSRRPQNKGEVKPRRVEMLRSGHGLMWLKA